MSGRRRLRNYRQLDTSLKTYLTSQTHYARVNNASECLTGKMSLIFAGKYTSTDDAWFGNRHREIDDRTCLLYCVIGNF